MSKRASVTQGSNPAEGGRKRTPLYEQRDKLTVKGKEPGYTYRWVNDVKEGSRLQAFTEAGYEFVDDAEIKVGDEMAGRENQLGSKVSRVVGSDSTRKEPVKAYLMRIKDDWYEEDQAAKQETINENEKGIVDRAGLSENEDMSGFYGKIKLERKF